jgi:hypothetical protein
VETFYFYRGEWVFGQRPFCRFPSGRKNYKSDDRNDPFESVRVETLGLEAVKKSVFV